MACFIDPRFKSSFFNDSQDTTVNSCVQVLEAGTCTSQRRTKEPAAPLHPKVASEEKRPGCVAEKEDFNKTVEI